MGGDLSLAGAAERDGASSEVFPRLYQRLLRRGFSPPLRRPVRDLYHAATVLRLLRRFAACPTSLHPSIRRITGSSRFRLSCTPVTSITGRRRWAPCWESTAVSC